MRFLLLSLLAIALAVAAWFGLDRYRNRFVRTDADLIRLLPRGDITTFYVNLAALRKGGLLHLVASLNPASTEDDYSGFIQATGFDYARDMDALAGALDPHGQIYFLIRGRFSWAKIQGYAQTHGLACSGDECHGPGSKPKRWVSFVRIQKDTVALAVGADHSAADLLRPPGRRVQDIPNEPVWLSVSPAVLKDPTTLPPALQLVALSIQTAQSVILSAAQANSTFDAFAIQMDAAFPSEPAADTAYKQMQIQTQLLKAALARENHAPNPADLTGLITAGRFQTGGNHVFARWPVRQELLRALE